MIDKIRKLLALANSSNPHEAALAAAEAQRLMLKHGIESVEVPDEVQQTELDMGTFGSWLISLAIPVARASFCEAFRSDGRLIFAGHSTNIAVAVCLFSWLRSEIDRMADEGWKKYKQGSANQWKKSFRMGAVSILSTRLEKSKTEQRQTTDTMALVRLDTYEEAAQQAITAYFRKQGIRLRQRNVRFNVNGSAFDKGYEAGAKIGLQPPSRALGTGK